MCNLQQSQQLNQTPIPNISSGTTVLDNNSYPLDFSNKYNTPLKPEQQAQYQQWVSKIAVKRGFDPTEMARDYDMQGYFLKYGGKESDQANGHFTDEFKKPNHPTFSNESQYSGKDGYAGGKWADNGDGSWSFTPSAATVKMWGKDRLKKYWDKAEPGNKLNLPEGD